jgi:hypothetical protein
MMCSDGYMSNHWYLLQERPLLFEPESLFALCKPDQINCMQLYVVIKATLDKLALVGVINVDLQEQAMTLTKTVGEEISVKIRLQRALELEFQKLIEQQHQLRSQANKVKKEVCIPPWCWCPSRVKESVGIQWITRLMTKKPEDEMHALRRRDDAHTICMPALPMVARHLQAYCLCMCNFLRFT